MSVASHQIDGELFLPIFSDARDDDNITRFHSTRQAINPCPDNQSIVGD